MTTEQRACESAQRLLDAAGEAQTALFHVKDVAVLVDHARKNPLVRIAAVQDDLCQRRAETVELRDALARVMADITRRAELYRSSGCAIIRRHYTNADGTTAVPIAADVAAEARRVLAIHKDMD